MPGIATQNVVERQALREKAAQEKQLGREAFIERGVGVETTIWRHHHTATEAVRRLMRLESPTLHDG